MASVSSATLVLFIASLLVAASVAGTMTNGVERIGAALGDRSADVSSEIRTDVAIISDAGSPTAIYNDTDEELTLLVKNTGSQTLTNESTNLELLLDGEYQTSVSTRVVGDADTWRPGSVLEVTVSGVSLSTGDHRVLLVVNGDREEFTFRWS